MRTTLKKFPVVFSWSVVEPMDRPDYPSLHTDLYDFSDDAIAVGIRMFVGLVS